MVRDRFIDGQAEYALRRHLDSLGPNTIPDIVDCCRIWERHCEVEIQTQTGADRRPMHVAETELIRAMTPETETVVNMIEKLLPTPVPPPLRAAPIRSDRDLLVQQLMAAICLPTLVAQERSLAEDLETLLLNWLPAGTVTEEDVVSPEPSTDSVKGCFSCGRSTHTMDECRTLDESFPLLPTGRQAEPILGPGSPPNPGWVSVRWTPVITIKQLELSRFQPLNRPHSLVDISSDSQVVMELPTHYETPAVAVDISALIVNPCVGWPAAPGPRKAARGLVRAWIKSWLAGRGGCGPDISFCGAVAGSRMIFCAGWVYILSPNCR